MQRIGAERDATDGIAPDFVLACIVALKYERAFAHDDDTVQFPCAARFDEVIEPRSEI
jgi:hypothetical protein